MLSDDVFFPAGYLQYSYVDWGMYAKHLVRWFKHFPLNTQLHVIESSELFANPLKVLTEVARFLEIRDFEDCSFPAHNLGIPMVSDDNDTAFLSSVFRDENERLFSILGKSRTKLRTTTMFCGKKTERQPLTKKGFTGQS